MAATSTFSSQSNREISDTLFVGVVVADPPTGKMVFAQAKIIPHEDVISLVFQTSTKMFPEMQISMQRSPCAKKSFEKFSSSIPENTSDLPITGFQRWLFCLGDEPELTKERIAKESREVIRVLINLELPYDPNWASREKNTLNAELIIQIGIFCRKMFPNLNAVQSAYNLHYGFSRYYADDQLLSSATHLMTIGKKI